VRFVVLVCTRVFTAEAPDTSGIPHAMVLRLIRDLPGDRALLPPSFAGLTRDLGASVGASGPHDFAVRVRLARQARRSRPSHPASRVRDVAQRPSVGRDQIAIVLIWGWGLEKILKIGNKIGGAKVPRRGASSMPIRQTTCLSGKRLFSPLAALSLRDQNRELAKRNLGRANCIGPKLHICRCEHCDQEQRGGCARSKEPDVFVGHFQDLWGSSPRSP